MSEFEPSNPEKEEVSLLLSGRNPPVRIKNFTEYSFNSNFLSPTDGFSFTIGDERLTDEMRQALKPGAAVQLAINNTVQSTGYIDSIEIEASRDSGTTWKIEGRDSLAQAVDSNADPTVSLKEGQTLAEAMKTIFKPFGWETDDQFVISNEANRDYKSNKYRAERARSDAKGFGRRALKSYKMHQSRPYPREGVYDFASRLANRFGLWIWASADGKQLIVSEPDFESVPDTKLVRKIGGPVNVLGGSVKFDISDQPTTIVADSYSRGGEFGRGRAKAIFSNVAVLTSDEEEKALEKYIKAGARVLGGHTFPSSSAMKAPRTRILFLHDDESATQEHLEAYVRREMALLQRKSLSVSYTVEGHGQHIGNGEFRIWTVDDTVKVEDDLAGLNEVLYILGRTFNKSRSSGTSTTLELIRLNTLVFSDGGAKSQ